MRQTVLLRVTAFLVVLLTGSALAQIDARSQALLDGLAQAEQAEAIETIDQTMVMTMYVDGEEMVTSMRSVIDYVNRRAVIFTDVGGGMFVRMVHVDGQTTMHMPGMPMAMPVPPGMGDLFDGIFDPEETLSDDPSATAVYDGQVSYGDIVSGEQVTYTATYDVLGTPTQSTSRLIFDASGQFIASVVEDDDGRVIIMVFDPPTTDNLAVPRGTTMYDFADGVGTVTSRTTYENVVVNQPLDETVFE